MTAPDIICQLVKRFEENRDSYRSGKYNETQLRREFLDPFLKALGWDIDNERGYAEAYKDVIHEDSLEVEGATKAPDYAFRIGGTRKFFVEAKKPAVNIEYDTHPAFQLRRYAWSAKLPLSLLTDFEELAVYESRSKPDKSDSAATGRVMLLHYKDYLTKWDEFAAIFSREAVLRGSFDQYAEGLKGKKGTTEVDDAFLQEIEHWRDLLARVIALRNPDLQVRGLNYAVQMTIDRIIFLRICEDRGIENENQLQDLIKGEGIYERLCQLFRQADSRYNSGLFHFSEEKRQFSSPDDLTLKLAIDDKTLKEIIDDLYYPSPYVFREIPADILGQVYERFLGKVIRLTAGHQAKVEEKPEVRKAGGVYYTPTYIVNYIVKSTVGKLLENKTPREAASLKILDPACGSGSFLLGAYQYLLDWHLKYYSDHEPEKLAKGKAPEIYQAQGGEWRLTTAEKKRILLNNIHGVDIDPQAVEVTKLSLSLKVLEGESQETIGAQLGLFKERALPDLGKNIQCGNSLIGPDYYEGRQLTMFIDKEEQYRVNAFNWQAAFPQVFIAGGFDAVIGNPPYRMMQPHNTEMDVLEYLRKKYLVAEFKVEMFHMFLQLGISLLKQNGFHGFIVPATILNNVYGETLRNWIMERCCIEKIAVANEKVFENADVHTLILILQSEKDISKRKENRVGITTELNQSFSFEAKGYSSTLQWHFSSLPGMVWNVLLNEQNANLILRLTNDFIKLGDIAKLNRGLITGDRDKFFSPKKLSDDYLPIVTGSDVNRYIVNAPSEYVLFKKPKGSGGSWDREVHLSSHKMLVRQIGIRPMAGFIQEPFAVTGNLFTVRSENVHDELYILGIFNSQLIEFFWKIMFSDFKSSFPQVTLFSLSQVPIRLLNQTDPKEKAYYEKIVLLVQRMLELNRQTTRTPQEKEMMQREIESTDKAIDSLVYELYGLTKEEIKIVEGN
jgi:type I restriction-modification system DNA methylase subunit